MAAADWIPIVPRHGRLLLRLRDQRKVDQYGCIGWLGLRESPEVFTPAQMFEPLLDRSMVEDGTRLLGASMGTHFVRVTDLGLVCLALGYMPRGRVTLEQVQGWIDQAQDLSRQELDALNPPKEKKAGR